MNLCVALKNISGIIVSMIKSISFDVYSKTNEVISTSDKVKTKLYSVAPNQETEVEFNNKELRSEIKRNVLGYFDSYKIVKLVWSFQCGDAY